MSFHGDDSDSFSSPESDSPLKVAIARSDLPYLVRLSLVGKGESYGLFCIGQGYQWMAE